MLLLAAAESFRYCKLLLLGLQATAVWLTLRSPDVPVCPYMFDILSLKTTVFFFFGL